MALEVDILGMFDVITIGTATRDAFVRSKDFRIISTPNFVTGQGLCLPAGAKVEVDDIVFASGGGATNAAVTFARQGFKTAAVCKTGDDVSGREVMSNLQKESVDTSFVIQDSAVKTAYAILILSAGGERTILVYRGASENWQTGDIDFEKLQAGWFYVSGSVPLDIIEGILNQADKIGAKVAMNPSANQIKLGLESLAGILKRLSVLIMNREEGAYLTGLNFKNEEKIFGCLDEYVDGVVVLTDGSSGAWVSDGQAIYRAGIYKEKSIVDRTGAGDAFGSGFAASLMMSNNIERAIRLASANATSVVEHVGAKAGILTKESFENDGRWKNLEIEIRKLGN
ncbi:MAG: carbohydrate kinase family protein [Patescibacteria group bacterium]